MRLRLEFCERDCKASRNIFKSNDPKRLWWSVVAQGDLFNINTLYSNDGYWFEPDMPASVMAKYYDGVDIVFEDGTTESLSQEQFANC